MESLFLEVRWCSEEVGFIRLDLRGRGGLLGPGWGFSPRIVVDEQLPGRDPSLVPCAALRCRPQVADDVCPQRIDLRCEVSMLCWFDKGTDSPFRFYYFLSLLVCAIRYSPTITYATFVFHALSYTILAVYREPWQSDDFNSFLLMLVFMGWATWAST